MFRPSAAQEENRPRGAGVEEVLRATGTRPPETNGKGAGEGIMGWREREGRGHLARSCRRAMG